MAKKHALPAIANGCRLLPARPLMSLPLLSSHAAHPVRLLCRRCGIPAANATYSSTVPPGGCITSCDNVRNRTAIFMAYGKAVPFMAGMFDPKAASGASGSRRLLSVWENYTYGEASLACSSCVSKTAWQGYVGHAVLHAEKCRTLSSWATDRDVLQCACEPLPPPCFHHCSIGSIRALMHCQPPRLKPLRPAPRPATQMSIVSFAAGV